MSMTVEQLERALAREQQLNARLRAEVTRLKNRLAPPTADEEEIHAHWKAVMGKPRAKLTAKGRQAIRTARREWSFEECIRAIDGNAAAGFTDDQGVRHNGLEVIMRRVQLNLDRFEAARDGVIRVNGKAGQIEGNVRALERMAES